MSGKTHPCIQHLKKLYWLSVPWPPRKKEKKEVRGLTMGFRMKYDVYTNMHIWY